MKNKMNSNGEWKVNQSEFKGFVKAKLEDIEKDVSRIHSKVDKLYWKVGGFSATLALVISIIGLVFMRVI